MYCSKKYSFVQTAVFSFLFAIVFPVLVAGGNPQPETVSKFLILKIPGSPRFSAVPIDPVEQSVVDGTFKAPKAGQTVSFGKEKSSVWKEASADEKGWLRPGKTRAFYAYLSVESESEKTVLLEGRAHNMVYVNGEPRVGNRYQYKDKFEAWEPKFDFSLLPVHLKKGTNRFLFKCYRGRLKVLIHSVRSPVLFNVKDSTLPDLIQGKKIDSPAAVVVINASGQPLKNLKIGSDDPLIEETVVPVIQPYSVRKVAFFIKGNAPAETGSKRLKLYLKRNGAVLTEESIELRVVAPNAVQKHTYISEIDGSVQYYALNPALIDDGKPKALFFSVHGANVEA
ncbi:MAG: hypothetical protein GXO77_02150, partial [Calditrichaeota bacterium]|nr:hypothetical protein [Calditrichota bacterium]